MSSLPATIALAASLSLTAVASDGDFEREARIRRWALDPAASQAELASALAADDWTTRHAALDALRRAALGARPVPAALYAAVDAGLDPRAPEVVAACDALAAGAGAQRLAGRAEQLGEHPLPDVRAALVRALVASGAGPERLAPFVGDPDPRVASVAIDALVPAGTELAGALAGTDRRPAFVELLRALERGGAPAQLLAALAGGPYADRREVLAALDARLGRTVDPADWIGGYPGPDEVREVFERAARRARADGDARVGELALRRAAESGDPWPWLALAAEAMEPAAVIAELTAMGAALDVDTRVAALEVVIGRAGRISARVLEPWVAPDRAAEARRLAAAMLAMSFEEEGSDAGPLLERLLGDPDPQTAMLAYRALAEAPDPGPRAGALLADWKAADGDGRAERLAAMPRGRAFPPFREALLGALAEPELRLHAAELLPALDGADVTGALAGRLGDASRALVADPDDAGLVGFAVALLRALGPRVERGSSGERALAAVAAALETARGIVSVAKVAVFELGRTPVGRERLPAWLDAPERRLRVEAALALADGDPRAAGVLVRDYTACDRVLRGRILTALGRAADERSIEHLAGVAASPEARAAERQAAIDSLAKRAAEPAALRALAAIAEAPIDAEAGRSAIPAYARFGGDAARALLRERFRAALTLAGPRWTWSYELETLALGLVAAGELEPLAGAWLEPSLRSAPADLAERFRGVRPAATAFQWSAELAVARAFARGGRLADALDRAGPWWTLDARLVAALGEVALEEGELATAERLLALARIALAGEGAVEGRERLDLDLRLGLVRSAAAREAWSELADRFERLAADWRAGRVDERGWLQAFGAYDPAAGRDPSARVASAALQARARAALAAGDRALAGELARAAAARIGASSAARAEQGRLEHALRSER